MFLMAWKTGYVCCIYNTAWMEVYKITSDNVQTVNNIISNLNPQNEDNYPGLKSVHILQTSEIYVREKSLK